MQRFTIVFISMLFFCNLSAQIIKVGSGTSSNNNQTYPAPYGNYYWGAKNQMVYLASELTNAGATAGYFSSIGFIITGINTGTVLEGFTISLDTTLRTTLTAGWEPDMEVYVPASDYRPVLGVNTHYFSKPFYWDGVSNIVVQVCFNNTGYTYNESTEWTTSLPSGTSIFLEEDDYGVCQMTGYTPSSNRPNALFSYLPDNDLMISGVDVPESACQLSTTETIKVLVRNAGKLSQSGFTLSYSVNGGVPVEETFSGTIDSLDEVWYTFSTPANFSADNQDYLVKAKVTLGSDENTSNDTLTASQTVSNYLSAQIEPLTVCHGEEIVLNVNPVVYDIHYWFDGPDATEPLFIGNSYTVEAGLYDIYLEGADTKPLITDTILNDKFKAVVHDAYSGDDRGGIAITKDYFYVVGDENTVRYKAIDLTEPVSLPIRDGIFSDLADGTLYTFRDTVSEGIALDSEFYVDPYHIYAIERMDENLELTGEITLLSDTIEVGAASGIFAGEGYVLLHNSNNLEWLRINLSDGAITPLDTFGIAMQGSESWAKWGWAESHNDSVYVYYRQYASNDIIRTTLGSEYTIVFSSFSNIDDMASITYSPWLNRMYWHVEDAYENYSGDEIAGYTIGLSNKTNNYGCRTQANVILTLCDVVEDHDKNKVLNLYPSVTSGNAYLGYGNAKNNSLRVNVVSVSGATVRTANYPGVSGNGTVEVNLEGLKAGSYFVKVDVDLQPSKTFLLIKK